MYVKIISESGRFKTIPSAFFSECPRKGETIELTCSDDVARDLEIIGVGWESYSGAPGEISFIASVVTE